MSKRRLSDDEILNLCDKHFEDASTISTIQEQREKALEAYNGDKYGDEVEGQSQVITSEVYDTIESILPDLIEVFVGNDSPVVFEPRDEQDIEPAQVETDYCNHVFKNQNDGFMIARTWFFDALVQKNGIVRAYWDEVVATEKETYEGISLDEYIQILSDTEIEIKAETANEDGTFDIEIERKSDNSQVRIENIPPEDFYVIRDHNSIDLSKCKYACHRMVVTENDLLDDGYDYDLIKDIPSYSESDSEKQERWENEGGVFEDGDQSKGSREIEIKLHYIRMDKGDGHKLYAVKSGGKTILDCDEVDRIDYHVLCPVPNPHKFYGKSKAEEVMSLQRINTVLMRQTLNNVTLSNNPMKIVKRNGNIDMKTLLSGRLGSVVLADDVMSVQDLTVPFMAGQTLPFFEYLDGVRERRTGVSQAQQGLTPEVLANSTNLVGGMLMNKAQGRIKLIARTFAETGFKSLMQHIHELSSKYDTQKKMVDFGSGFIQVDPRSWRKRIAMSVRVGVGYAEKQDKVANLINVINYQKEAIMAQMPIVSPVELYASLVDLGKLIGVHEVKRYFKDPATIPPPEPQPDPLQAQIQAIHEQGIMDMQKKAAEIEQKSNEFAADLARKRHEFEQDMELKKEKLHQDYELAIRKMTQEYDLTKHQTDHTERQNVLAQKDTD